MSEVKQSINRVQIVGTLKEINLEEQTKEVNLKNGQKEKKVTCRVLSKKEFKNPMFLIEVNGKDIEIDMFGANEKKLDENGNVVDNKNFKSLQTISGFKPMIECKDGEVPTRVKVEGYLRANEYAKDDDWKSFPVLTAFNMSHTQVPDTDSADGEISGIIKNITPEVKIEDETEIETGRLKVEFYYFDRNGDTYPVTFMVEEDIADAVLDTYEAGNSCKLYYETIIKHVGAKKVSNEGGFGRRDANITSGFSVTEYNIFKGSDPFDNENEYFVSIDSMKEAMEARNVMIETKIAEAKNKDKTKNTEPKSSPKGASKGIGRRDSKISGESPF